jgi:hypothetical protein
MKHLLIRSFYDALHWRPHLLGHSHRFFAVLRSSHRPSTLICKPFELLATVNIIVRPCHHEAIDEQLDELGDNSALPARLLTGECSGALSVLDANRINSSKGYQ